MNNNKKTIISDEELSFTPEKDLKVIKNDTGNKKYPMILEYTESANRTDVIQKLAKLKCPVLSTLDFANCILVNLTKSEIKEVEKCNFIKSVERNYKYDLLESADMSRLKVNSVHDSVTHKTLELLKAHDKKNKKVKVAVFDTGIEKHPALNIAGGVCFVGNGMSYTDTDGHGTKMAGIITSSKDGEVNPIELYAVKIFDDSGHTTTDLIIRGINWAIENKMNIINMSFGIYYPSALLKKYIDRAADNGIIIIAAVGNDGGFKDKHRIMYPAKYENVIAVGSGSAYAVSDFSNNSADLDFVAPGSTVSTDINGAYSSITGTSVSCAYITSIFASIWSIRSDIGSAELIKVIKSSGKALSADKSYVGFGEIDAEEALTKINKYDTIDADKASKYSAEILDSVSDISYSVSAESIAVPVKSNSRSSSGNCYEEFMETAIPLNLSEFRDVTYEQLREGIWYTFTADAIDAHPGIGTGFYYIYTFGLSDTIGMLFDSSGHRLAYDDGDSTRTYRGFEIYSELEYDKTYYIYVREKDLKGGKVAISVVPMDDDHGNSMETETYLGNVYTQNLSVSGFLHNAIDQDYHGDLDYFSFRATKDCVVEIFLENSPEAYFSLYDKNGTPVNHITYDTVNDDLRITYAIKGEDMYFVEVSKLDVDEYATHYTLNVKFVKDYSNNIIDEQYRVMYWYALNQDEYPAPLHSVTRSMVYVSNRAKAEFEDRVILDEYNQKTGLRTVLDNGNAQNVLNYLLDKLISSIPLVGTSLSYAFNVGSMIYDFMSLADLTIYHEQKNAIENTSQFIVGKHYWFNGYLNAAATGNHTTYTVGSGTYYGADYQKGIFIETYIKHK